MGDNFFHNNCTYLLCIFKRQMWSDYRLRWNPAEYEGVAVISFPSGHLWTPDLLLYNRWEQNRGIESDLAGRGQEDD